MTLLSLLRGLSTSTLFAKLKRARSVEENTRPEASETLVSAPTASENKTLSGGRSMTKEEAKKKIRDWCMSQVGYHESLDGSNKYADGIWDMKLYGFDATNVPWCDVFVDYSFIRCFGYDNAVKMTYQEKQGYALCRASADAYKANGAFFKRPEVGDQVFFIYGGEINHTGIVMGVDGDTITCVEGNYSDGVGFTRYNLRNTYSIAGYGRPDWSVIADDEQAQDFTDVDDTQFDIVHPEHRRTFLHLEYGDGDGNPSDAVVAWQSLLQCWGYDLGIYGADGEFGFDTENATRQWQAYVQNLGADVEVNGIVDEDDWREIINVEGME